MDVGTFSLSLAVDDIAQSLEFYQKLGFTVVAGLQEQNWLILQNGSAKIGLFQGMFQQNLITFNPPDARAIQASLKEQGVQLIREAEGDEGPAHLVLADPDGNTILIDQH